MGRRGKRPPPTALTIARGNPGKRPINLDEPELPASETDPPADMDGRALVEWNHLASTLVNSGVLTMVDRSCFETYCRLVQDEEEYQKLVAKGREDAHKLGYASFLLKIRAQKKQYAAELGLTPSSRTGVKVKKPVDAGNARRKRFFKVHDGNAARPA